MFIKLAKDLLTGAATRDYADPLFHFSYHGFGWLGPLPAGWTNLLFALLAISALGVALGAAYRWCAIILAIGLTYLFLLDLAYYLNHDYLICLLAGWLAVVSADREWSVDAWRQGKANSQGIPAWQLRIFQFQLALPYVFGGIAKLNGDWLRGQPMHSWLPESPLPHLVGDIATTWGFAVAMSWGGLLLDLFIVPLLVWQRSRPFAVVAVVLFHLTNAVMLDIGVFPWLMILSIFVFFPADWPRRKLSRQKPKAFDRAAIPPFDLKRICLAVLLAVYVTIQIALPLRHLLIPGNASWTEEGHYFAWRMMLRDKNTAIQVLVKQGPSGAPMPVDPSAWLTRFQFESMGQDPEMMRQFAVFLGQQLAISGYPDASVHIVAIASLNGRKPQLLFDPRLDLSRVPPNESPLFGHRSWITPLRQPFLTEPWNEPVIQWPQMIDNREWLTELYGRSQPSRD